MRCSMDILNATPSDVKKLAPLFDQYRQFYKQSCDLPAAEDFLFDRLTKNESIVFYTFSAPDILGFVQLYPSFSSIGLKPLWILNDLYVTANARRKNIAKGLIVHAAAFVKASGGQGLTLKTSIENTPAQSLYGSLGWKRNERFCSYDFKFI